ncbi:unnamed protein product [marine sediment metagenome]|uniref:GIY-YIG domain-containing protein n=1 Tax=marine sediment metagenome TaxID=412755 RepID=X0WD60_9ZZZZ
MRYVGLTDDPKRREQEHGNPRDFRVVHDFNSEKEARQWEKQMLTQGYKGDVGGAGWRHGYTYSV